MDSTRRLRGLCRLVGLALLAASTARADGPYDYCSTVVVRPDQYFQDATTCTKSYSNQDIAAGAQAVLIGDFTDLAHPTLAAPPTRCRPSPSHAANAPYVQQLKAARAAAGGPPLWIVHLSRFDLVPAVFAAQPQFDARYLVTTTRPFTDVTGFFANDRSTACLGRPCRWSDSWKSYEGRDNGTRLRDFIDRSSGSTSAHERADYYLARPDGTGVYWPTAAIANLGNASYRAWRVAEAKEALKVGGYSTIELNHKLQQFLFGPHWIASSMVRDVATLNALGDTLWSAPPSGYAYANYVQGLVQLSRDLRNAGVPYSFTIALRSWSGDSFDDKTTPTVNEAELVREIMRGARVVFLDRAIGDTPAGMLESATRDLNAAGVAVVPIDQSCGLRIEQKLAAPEAPSLGR